MAGITSAGVGSGIDIKSLVQQLVAAEGQPKANRLNTKEATYQAQLSAIGTFKGALSGLQSSLSNLISINTFQSRTAVSGDTSIVMASADSTAVAGSYQIEVSTLAKAHTLRSQVFTSNTSSIGTGTLTFQFGDPTKAAQTVTISSGNDSLDGIAKAVNAANIGVQASVVKGATGYQMVFTSATSGTANSLKVSVAESPANGTNTDMLGLSQLAYDPNGVVNSGKNLVEAQAAVDATAKINGIGVTSSTNTISDFVQGVRFTLAKTTAVDSPVTVTVAEDKNAVTTAVQGFIKAYNSLVSNVKSISGYDSSTKKGGILIGDAMVRGVMNQVRQVISGTVPGGSGKYQSLADIGIKTQADGTLALDTAKLSTAMSGGVEEVGRLFSAMGTTSEALVKYQSSTADTKKGTYDVNISQLSTKGTYVDAASSVSSLLVDATNDTFAIKVDGIQSGTISLSQKTYATAQDLAAELQSRINGDTALKGAGVSVSVGFDGTRFTFTSDRFGSASNVQITTVKDVAASGGIGLTTAGTTTAGLDVAGSIGTDTASGSGQYLTGAGDAKGLKLLVQGSTTGSRGTVVFSRGLADQLNTALTQMLGKDNPLDSRTTSINKSVDQITKDRERLSLRLEALSARYTAQFTAMDKMVAQLNSTGSFLSQRLSSMSG